MTWIMAISALCSSNFQLGTYAKNECQNKVIECVLKGTKVDDSERFKERKMLECYLKSGALAESK